MKTMNSGAAVARVLELDLRKVKGDGFQMSPLGNGDWLVTWEGVAVLDKEAAAILFANEATNHTIGDENA